MGRRQNRKKTRRTKVYAANLPEYGHPEITAASQVVPEINLTPMDYNSMSEIGKAALDNVIALTGRTKEEILLQNA